jgi:hypothetical protein
MSGSQFLEDLTNFRSWREAESSIRIQEGPPANQWLDRCYFAAPLSHRTRNALLGRSSKLMATASTEGR